LAVDRAALLEAYADVGEELLRHFDVADLLDELRTSDAGKVNGRAGSAPIESFGDYEVLEELGRGGMAVVYKARQKSLNRLVALKFPTGGALAGAHAAERFRQEAVALAQLRHPNIVAIHEVGEHAGRTYLSMEYVEGVDLAKRLRDDPPSIRQAVEYARTIAAAIAYAHAQGIVHRDLKPANVLVDRSGSVRVADFGLGKILAADHSLTQTGQILGTLRYMAPEQTDNTGRHSPQAGDIYSIGAILYELLCGRPAFWANSTLGLLRQIHEQEPLPLRQLDRRIPKDLETICLKCLTISPAKRYATAGGLVDDLDRFSQGAPVTARPISRREKLWRWCRRHPGWTATILFVAISSQSRQGRPCRERARTGGRTTAATPVGASSQRLVQRSIATGYAGSCDRGELATAGSDRSVPGRHGLHSALRAEARRLVRCIQCQRG
jgi:serine/threonine protein kinase